MKYRPTPLNILSTLVIISSVWELVENEGGAFGFGVLWVIIATGISVFGLFIDLIIQKFSSRYYWILGIETLLILVAATLYYYSQRTKTLVISDLPTIKHIVTVYGVDNRPKLSDKLLPWSYKIRVPDDGIILTSSPFESDLPQTKVVSYSGIELNTAKSDWGWIRFGEGQFDCNGKSFRYRSWMLRKDYCCGYTAKDIDSLRMGLQRRLCDQLMPSR
jgi:hypothetical protein